MKTGAAYGLLIVYGLLTMATAFVGNFFWKTNGFSRGYITGAVLSVVLWFFWGAKAVQAPL